MTDTVTRQPATDFGIGFAHLRDRDNDWWSQRDDLPTADQSVLDDRLNQQLAAILGQDTTTRKAKARLVVDMDLLEPAKPVKHTVTPLTISNEPHFFEDGMAWWITDYGVVGYDMRSWSKAASVAADHGVKARSGKLPTDYGFTVLALDETVGELPPEMAWPAGMGRRNYAYTLWTIVHHAVTPGA